MKLSKLELQTYRVEQCEESQLSKIKEFYKKLKIEDIMTIEGMYIIFWKELKALNLNKIHNFEQLCKKRRSYKKHLKRVQNRQITN